MFDGGSAAPSSLTAIVHEPRGHIAMAEITVSDTKLDFDSVPLGQGVGLTLVFQNVGDDAGGAPVMAAVTTRGASSPAFFVDTSPTDYGPDGCPNLTTLAPGQVCTFVVSFAPPDDTSAHYKGAACFSSDSGDLCVRLTGRLDQTA